MARKPKKGEREARKLADAGLEVAVMGGAFVLLPLFLGKSPLAQAFASLRSLGWLLLLGGVALLLLVRRSSSAQPVAQTAPQTEGQQLLARISRESKRTPSAYTRPAASPVEVVPPTGPVRSVEPLARPLEQPEQWGRAVFDVIEWRRFEAVIERLFQQAGFETTSQTHGADEGVDVWLYSRHQPGQPVSLVQCKHWQGKKVGVDKIRELRGVMAARQVKRGQFATTSTFTPDAMAFAGQNSINLLDIDGLLKLIAQRTHEQQAELLAVALAGEYWRPTCVNCGDKMTERLPRSGGQPFWGCSNYPRCKKTMPMRQG